MISVDLLVNVDVMDMIKTSPPFASSPCAETSLVSRLTLGQLF